MKWDRDSNSDERRHPKEVGNGQEASRKETVHHNIDFSLCAPVSVDIFSKKFTIKGSEKCYIPYRMLT
jgi:hypothetical protein